MQPNFSVLSMKRISLLVLNFSLQGDLFKVDDDALASLSFQVTLSFTARQSADRIRRQMSLADAVGVD
jgi:hypothetical protein